MKPIAIGMLVLALSVTLAAQGGQRSSGSRQPNLSRMDSNGDGKISREEARIWKWPDLLFDWKDLNDDGFVDLSEFRSWMTNKRTRDRMLHLDTESFRQMDTNHDGKISYKEECWCSEDTFRKLDLNHDGFLTKAEAFHKIHKLRYIKPRKFKKKKAKNP